jgi:hypothetical protein
MHVCEKPSSGAKEWTLVVNVIKAYNSHPWICSVHFNAWFYLCLPIFPIKLAKMIIFLPIDMHIKVNNYKLELYTCN